MSDISKGLLFGVCSGVYCAAAMTLSFFSFACNPVIGFASTFAAGMFYPVFLGRIGFKL